MNISGTWFRLSPSSGAQAVSITVIVSNRMDERTLLGCLAWVRNCAFYKPVECSKWQNQSTNKWPCEAAVLGSNWKPYGADDINQEENHIGGSHRPQRYCDACQHLHQVKMELKCRTLRAFSGKFLKFQKSAGLKYLINVMFGRGRGGIKLTKRNKSLE